MGPEIFYCRLPWLTEVGSMLQDEIPVDSLSAAEIGHCFVSDLLLQEGVQLFEEASGTDKVCVMVTWDQGWFALSGNESHQAG